MREDARWQATSFDTDWAALATRFVVLGLAQTYRRGTGGPSRNNQLAACNTLASSQKLVQRPYFTLGIVDSASQGRLEAVFHQCDHQLINWHAATALKPQPNSVLWLLAAAVVTYLKRDGRGGPHMFKL